ncbi:adenosylcobinamide-GDP ribazoletransferase [Clostridium chauvoei]|uniref:Adenosylcobinamide-GDP ribazoletransferase n=2 Tax=Clostridium chauvoei TaxID=46867 RepID=A0A1U6JJ78_9CLOT|nr:adenosylcobinamide-GDP ribazoletransferase [Clostridium chauvoei]ATD55520.1 adenosylcobinamide-GDP ribazoletransferase [Clostridium chauvoei]ATD56804.1 adenosylcobinamide-GDP ribazoletransferase [Clostridium chauvoei]MBX7281207.1 adenosylcobinamide-GDP ribazoletransferase [Clostridium chauvoei]MBX7283689.1 adenosylcobinamide-GDP ribazoletransferase [Clostridium chauvoei]MBX7286297.1 adenosylcobinamide-GDP ribazoletransferase [Clostridium chauvoei]
MKKYFKGFLMAVSMFTVIPLPYYEWDDEGARNILKFYPIVGLIVGLIWYLIYIGMIFLGASTILITAITMVAPFIITGMLHLDGYMDVCDALFSRREMKEKVRILKDPNTGAFAVISLAILFIVQFSAVYTIVDKQIGIISLVFIPIVSRSTMSLLLLTKESMKESSLGSYFKKGTGKFDRVLQIIILIIMILVFYRCLNIKGVIIPISMVILGITVVNNSSKQLGGMSGDSAGFGLVISELVGILLLAFI